MDGVALGPQIVNGGTEQLLFSAPMTTVTVDNTAIIGERAVLNSLSNNFSVQPIGASVPEPGALALMLLGVSGVAIATWRRRR